LFYLAGHLFSAGAAFAVIVVALRQAETEDIGDLVGLHERSPLLAATLTLAMASLAGIPPLVGFFGKFLLLKAVLEQGAAHSGYYLLAGIALAGVVISVYYYLGVVRAVYGATDPPDRSPIQTSRPMRLAIYTCLGGMLGLGLFPGALVDLADEAARVLRF
jgi:NADH-quinone oxidoreductase subunit N